MTGAAPVYGVIFRLIRDEGTLVHGRASGGEVPVNSRRTINQKCLTVRARFGRRGGGSLGGIWRPMVGCGKGGPQGDRDASPFRFEDFEGPSA